MSDCNSERANEAVPHYISYSCGGCCGQHLRGAQARIWQVSAREELTAVAVAMLSIAEFGRKIVRVDRRPTQNLLPCTL